MTMALCALIAAAPGAVTVEARGPRKGPEATAAPAGKPQGALTPRTAPPAAPPPPGSPPGLSAEERRRALLLADLLIEEGRYAEAAAFAKERMSADSERDPWLLRVARALAGEERPAEAAAIYRDILSRNPEDSGLLLRWGIQAHAAGDEEGARSALEKADSKATGPLPAFHLSEIAYGRGDEAAGRRWVERALALAPPPRSPSEVRLRLRLKSRLGWDDFLDLEYRRLFAARPKDAETLFEWHAALMRAGLIDAAAEPLALIHERFPEDEARWKRARLEWLRKAGRDSERAAFLEECLSASPAAPDFLLAAGESRLRLGRWRRAAAPLLAASTSARHRDHADRLLVELGRRFDHHLGPSTRMRFSEHSRVLEEAVEYRGHPLEGLRVEAEAGTAEFLARSRSRTSSLSGGALSGTWLLPGRSFGADLDLRSGRGATALSPGLSAQWDREGLWSVSGQAAYGRAWDDSAPAVDEGARADRALASGHLRPVRRLGLGGYARLERLTLSGGPRGRQTVWAPGATWTLLERPAHLTASARFVSVDATGDSAFFERLPLLRRSRTHYAALNAGRGWRNGRVRADGYLYNGHDPGRGRRFLRADLLGVGGSVEALLGRVRAAVRYEFSREADAGFSGRSHSVRLALHWTWPGHEGARGGAP